MAQWMLFALAPGLALCCAALLAEQAARQRRWPSRYFWLAAMVGSIVLPALGPAFPQLAPLQLPSSAVAAPNVLADVAPVISQVGAEAHPRAMPLARTLWIALSFATVAALAGCAALIRHRARHWRRTLIDGRETFVAPESGPAVFGWWHPRIVLPEWLASAPTRQRELALAHEQSHLDAHDPQLLGIALALLAIMPWNLALWWQLRRIRQAIEVDCDSRVLGRGHDLFDYGEALLALGLRRSQRYGLMSASDSSRSLLERRIRIMSSQPAHWSRVMAGTLLGLSLCAVAIAAELAPTRAAHATASTPIASPLDLVAPPAPPASHSSPALAAPRAPHALPAQRALPALPAPPPPPPSLPALAAAAPLPPLPPVAAVAPAASDESEADESAADAVEAAKAEAEEAAERAAELKNDAEEADKAAKEAMQDALEQQKQAEDAKHEAEAAAAEAMARKQASEAAAHAAQSSNRVN